MFLRISNILHKLTSLKSRIALQVARKIVLCDSALRWLKTVNHKMESSRFRLVFLDCLLLMSNNEYRTDVKHRPKGSNSFTEAT